MIAVIFEVWPADGHKQTYLDIAARLKPELEQIDGFLSIERFQSLTDETKLPSLNPESDRVMICGNTEMLADLRKMLEGLGFAEGSGARPGAYVFERAFVDK